LRLNPFALVLENGFRLGFGSDNMPFGPLYGITGATGHPVPGFRLSCQAALQAYTLGSAWMCGFHHLAVPLGPGRPADMAVLSGNPFDAGFEGLEVVATLRGGSVVHGPPDLLSREE
jgi:predicted amidohydrolase YtcJ